MHPGVLTCPRFFSIIALLFQARAHASHARRPSSGPAGPQEPVVWPHNRGRSRMDPMMDELPTI